jgi:hypothetical protein
MSLTPNPTASKLNPAKVLEAVAREGEETKELEACLERRRHFAPSLCSVDGLLGREAKTFAKRLLRIVFASKLSSKWEKSYSQICGYVTARLSVAIVRATHLWMRGSRVPAHKISIRYPQ